MLNITRYEVWLTNSLIHKKKEQKRQLPHPIEGGACKSSS